MVTAIRSDKDEAISINQCSTVLIFEGKDDALDSEHARTPHGFVDDILNFAEKLVMEP